MPKQLEKGMWFVSKQKDIVFGEVHEYLKVHELKEVPQDMDSYIAINGAPVEPYVVQPMNNPDDKEHIIATPDQIGWWDDGDESEDLEDLTVKIINDYIYGESGYDGAISIEMLEDDEGRNLVLFHGKVTIRHYELLDDNFDWDDDDDNWDDMDDNPEEY
jgi:hypothetical protein